MTPEKPPVIDPAGVDAPRPGLWKPIVGAIVLVAASVMTFAFNPTEHNFFPQCTFHQMTGWHCMGCGATRSFHALVHGDFAAAFRNHAFFVIAFPALCYWVLVEFMARLGWQKLPRIKLTPRIIWTSLAIIGTYTILRNLPLEPFASWAPLP